MGEEDKIIEDKEELMEDDEIEANEEGFLEGYEEDEVETSESKDDVIDPEGKSFYGKKKGK